MAGDVLTFGDGLELDRVAYELRRSGRSLKLERIPMEILLLLVERRGQLVSRADIIEKVWGKNIHVDTDNSINAAIRKIRQVLKDDPERPVFVQTVTGKGYRFIAPVGAVVDGIGESNPENTSPWNGAFGPRGNGQGQLTFTPESGSITVAPPASQKSTSRLEETVSFFGTADPAVEEPRQDSLTLRGVRFRLLLLLALCAVAALLAARFRPVARAPHVTRVRQITHVGAVIPNENLVVTVSRIYFEDSEKGENQILSVSLGGETIASIEKPFRTTVFLTSSLPATNFWWERSSRSSRLLPGAGQSGDCPYPAALHGAWEACLPMMPPGLQMATPSPIPSNTTRASIWWMATAEM
jgi:DNA-binding winged helix-turn-helix (wHTH) protein